MPCAGDVAMDVDIWRARSLAYDGCANELTHLSSPLVPFIWLYFLAQTEL